MTGDTPTIFGDGEQTRDFTHVANAVYANLLAATSANKLAGQVLNIACGKSASVLDLLTKLADRLGVEPAWTCAEPRPGEVRDSLASIDAARALIDYHPIIDLDEGLDETAVHYRDYFASRR